MATRLVALACGFLLSLSGLERKYCSVSAAALAMHSPTYSDLLPLIKIKGPSNRVPSPQVKLLDLIKTKVQKRERFYGIEVSARSKSELDFDAFKVNPLFTSVVWVGESYANVEPISEAAAVKCATLLKKSSIVLPHLTCYNMTEDKLNQFPLEEFKNFLILRGDTVSDKQPYKYAVDLVREIRNRRKDNVSIAVGGYPEVHPTAISKELDLRYLKEKVDAGADVIITQICFSARLIIDFIKDCRKMGIQAPIIPGIYIPKNYNSLNGMCKVTKVCPPEDQMKEYKRLQGSEAEFQKYAFTNAKKLIRALFESNLDIYGIQIFTLNYFDNVREIVNEFF